MTGNSAAPVWTTRSIVQIFNGLGALTVFGVVFGAYGFQFVLLEPPCPLCLVQRSGMIALAVGPRLNLFTGLKVRNYAFAILAACVGGAGSVRQILLHIATPGDPGYGPQVLGFHLYTWADITFLIAVIGIAILLMWPGQFETNDRGILGTPGVMRVLTITVAAWYLIYLVAMTIFIIPTCGIGMCPADPAETNYLSSNGAWLAIGGAGILSLLIGIISNSRMRRR